MRYIDKIIIHCSATTPEMDVGVKEISKWHVNRGFSGCGYHFVIRRDGVIEKGRDIWVAGAHAKGFNNSSIGICWVGGVDSDLKEQDNRTQEQKSAMSTLIKLLGFMFDDADVCGHRDLPNVKKACPSFDVNEWMNEENKRH